jgi:hypothetical protein
MWAPAPPALNFSRAAETDGDFAGFDDNRYLAAAFGKLKHLLQPGFVFQDVDILMRNLATGESLPGPGRVGSEIFSEYQDFFIHDRDCATMRGLIENKRGVAKLQVSGAVCYFHENFLQRIIMEIVPCRSASRLRR